jgi:AcrR family transcriptional regulator
MTDMTKAHLTRRTPAVRTRYHHGDLANALTREATALAREGGPEAVVLREAARRVGVSATAAYRHFAAHDELLYAVKMQAHEDLADTMDEALRTTELPDDPGQAAIQRLLAVGRAYVRFALTEPGLFRTAFCRIAPACAGQESPLLEAFCENVGSFGILVKALDALVATGVLTPERRAGAEFPVWSGVHGVAQLLQDGPLACLPTEQRDDIRDSTLRLLLRGLTA